MYFVMRLYLLGAVMCRRQKGNPHGNVSYNDNPLDNKGIYTCIYIYIYIYLQVFSIYLLRTLPMCLS